MPNEPRWLDAAALVEINVAVVAKTGEPHLTLDLGLLESAAARPINRWLHEGVEDVVPLASTLLFGIARNHPFQQGNKRTAWVAFVIMLELNGRNVVMPDQDTTAQAIVEVITGERDEVWFYELVAPHIGAS